MSKRQKQAENLRNTLMMAIRNKISLSGIDSPVNNNKGIKVTPRYDCNSIGHSIKECQHEHVIDERELYYDYQNLSIDELAELADVIKA